MPRDDGDRTGPLGPPPANSRDETDVVPHGPAGVALYVTENGAAYEDTPDADGFVADDERRDFIDLHLRDTHAAIASGADVGGYFTWSLMDNFEWAWGYHQRFGIVRVDYDTQAPTPKSSAL